MPIVAVMSGGISVPRDFTLTVPPPRQFNASATSIGVFGSVENPFTFR